MKHFLEIAGSFAVGAAVILGIGLAIAAGSSGLELIALR